MEEEPRELEILMQPEGVRIGGLVNSVNGMTGDVILTTSDLENTSDYQTGSEVESAIRSAVSTEATARENADTALQTSITNLQTDLGNEVTNRTNADNNLQTQIDAITSSSDVVDIVGTYAELQTYPTAGLGDNDVIKVLQDETHNDAMSYYRWSITTQTWTYIGSEGPYYTKGETNILLQAKQDKLTAGNGIAIDSNNVISTSIPDGFFDGAASVVSEDGTTLGVSGSIKLKTIKLKGDTKQQTYTGANLFNVNTITPPTGATINDDGSITCVYDNTSGSSTHYINLYPANLDLQTSTTYAAFAEIISLTGGGTLAVINGSSSASQFTNNKTFNLADYQTGDIIKTTDTTKADFSGTNAGTRTYVSVQAGLSLSLTFRMSVIADTTVTPEDFVYQPYVGGIPSPNPSYPQEVKTVTGEQTVEVRGKNMFNRDQIFNGFINDSGVLVQNDNWQFSDFILVSPNTEYVLSCVRKEGTTGSLQLRYASYQSNDEASFVEIYASNDVSELAYTTPDNCKYIRVGYRKDRQIDIQLEPGSTATAYEPYVGQTYTIDLGSIELCKIGNYQDYIYNNAGDWYIHKEVGITTDSIGSTGITINDMATDGAIYSYCGGTVSGSTVTYASALTTQNTIYYQLASTTETLITDSALNYALSSVLNTPLYQPTTFFTSNGDLTAILNIESFNQNLAGILGMINALNVDVDNAESALNIVNNGAGN